ncbi:MAG TPA: class II aldolase/adducin family protein [Solirubrobacterales bacterium]|nr:class II aldolase/adducin family protein [Solirubrobacterales bacterium]
MSGRPGGGVLAAARALAAAGLVDAFGHVSARDGDVALITPAVPMAAVSAVEELVELPLGELGELPAGAPKEAWIHWAIYRRQPEVGAIVRGQPASPLALAAVADELPAVLGQGAIAGAPVPVFPDSRLVRDRARAIDLAEAMGEAPSLIMRGNGALATASTPGRAMARLYLLERSADTWLRAAAAGDPRPLSDAEAESWAAAGEELLERLWRYLEG